MNTGRKMITAFKPSKPDRPRTHCLKQDQRMKNRILCVNDENSKRNICSYCISKTYCHLGHKNGRRSTIGCTRPQNNMFEKRKKNKQKQKNINTVHTTTVKYYILHVIYHMNGTQLMSAISNHDFNTKTYVKDPRYDKRLAREMHTRKYRGLYKG